MFAVIRKNADRTVTITKACRGYMAAVFAAELERDCYPGDDRPVAIAIMDDGGLTEIG